MMNFDKGLPRYLYHGTCSHWLEAMKEDNFVKPAEFGETHLSLTDNWRIALTYTQTAIDVALSCGAGSSYPVILKAETRHMVDWGLEPFKFTSEWSEDWAEEREYAIKNGVPLEFFSVQDMPNLKRHGFESRAKELADALLAVLPTATGQKGGKLTHMRAYYDDNSQREHGSIRSDQVERARELLSQIGYV